MRWVGPLGLVPASEVTSLVGLLRSFSCGLSKALTYQHALEERTEPIRKSWNGARFHCLEQGELLLTVLERLPPERAAAKKRNVSRREVQSQGRRQQTYSASSRRVAPRE